jgi:hypothetical protein
MSPERREEKRASVTYTLEGNLIQVDKGELDTNTLEDGKHSRGIKAIDKFGITTSETGEFTWEAESPRGEGQAQKKTGGAKTGENQGAGTDQKPPKTKYPPGPGPTGEREGDQKTDPLEAREWNEGKNLN